MTRSPSAVTVLRYAHLSDYIARLLSSPLSIEAVFAVEARSCLGSTCVLILPVVFGPVVLPRTEVNWVLWVSRFCKRGCSLLKLVEG